MNIPGADERWENWMQFVQVRNQILLTSPRSHFPDGQGYMLPRFTEQGFEVVKTPEHVHAKLKAAVDEGVANWDSLRDEENVVS